MNVSRRRLLYAGAVLALRPVIADREKETYRFRTSDVEVEMTIQFHDRYSSRGFWFTEGMTNRHFCLSDSGEEGRNCLSEFHGSLAVAQYRVRPRSGGHAALALRELVRTIDRDFRLPDRAPFEQTIVLDRGIGTDLQAFGSQSAEQPLLESHGPWYILRQDLYLEPQPAPLLILYWKHTLTSIRVLDVIPGENTWTAKE